MSCFASLTTMPHAHTRTARGKEVCIEFAADATPRVTCLAMLSVQHGSKLVRLVLAYWRHMRV